MRESSVQTHGDKRARPGASRRLRGKYAERACVHCRRSKLKCSGTEPCLRCSRRGRDCIFIEDRGGAQVGRDQSGTGARRTDSDTTGQLPRPQSPNVFHGVGYPTPQLNNSAVESDRQETVNDIGRSRPTSMTDIPQITMLQEKVSRIEAMLEGVLVHLQQSSRKSLTAVGTSEPYAADAAAPDDYQGDTALEHPINAFNATLPSFMMQLGMTPNMNRLAESAATTHENNPAYYRSSNVPWRSLVPNNIITRNMQVRSRNFPFPTSTYYEDYMNYFFTEVNPCHPCVNEVDFRERSQRLARTTSITSADVCFLALNYIIFACADVLRSVTPKSSDGTEPVGPQQGWHWFLVADEIVGKKKLSGQGDLSLIQYLVYESFYLIHADKPNASYNSIGLACRMCFRFGLHQQSLWGQDCTPYALHMRQRIFWTAYFADRRISLSTGRPYCMRDLDIDVQQPTWLDDNELKPDHPLPPQDLDKTFLPYLTCITAFAKLGGEILDKVFSAKASRIKRYVDSTEVDDTIFALDAKIKHWLESVLPGIPVVPSTEMAQELQTRQLFLVRTRFLHLRLLLHRRMLFTEHYTPENARESANAATQIIRILRSQAADIDRPSSSRFYMTTTLAGALVVLGVLLVRKPLVATGLDVEFINDCIEQFRDGVAMLEALSKNLRSARRVLADLQNIIDVVMTSLSQANVPVSDGSLVGGVDSLEAQRPLWLWTDMSEVPCATTDFVFQPDDLSGSRAFEPDGSNGTNGMPAGSDAIEALLDMDTWQWESPQGSINHGVPWIL